MLEWQNNGKIGRGKREGPEGRGGLIGVKTPLGKKTKKVSNDGMGLTKVIYNSSKKSLGGVDREIKKKNCPDQTGKGKFSKPTRKVTETKGKKKR